MKRLHIDCTFGIAGDMLLAALVDLGADLDSIAATLHRLPIDPFELDTQPVDRCGIRAQLLRIDLGASLQVHGHPHDHVHNHPADHSHPHRRAGDILEMVSTSALPGRVKQRATAIFTAIAQAEGRIHGIDPAEVHLHEVGAMDSIIDILGVCLALEALDVDSITATPVPTGHGVVRMAHGRFPIPAPATLELLKGVPLSTFDAEGELTTPTGAAFLATLVDDFRSAPAGMPEKIGYGAGNHDFAHPNVLRAVAMAPITEASAWRETIAVLECQLDDITGEHLGHVMDVLLDAGALDVFFTPVTMKKSRPGTLLTVLAPPDLADSLELLLLRQTPTFGVRRHDASRRILDRRIVTVETPLGAARVKLGFLDGRLLRATPEFEDVRRLASEHERDFVEVQQCVLEAWRTWDVADQNEPDKDRNDQ